jgi:hypothetical protein
MNPDEAMEDLMMRVGKYEDQYETVSDESQSYIKIFNLSTKLMVNHIYGRMAKLIVPALMAWNVGTRPVFLTRAGQVPRSQNADGDDQVVQHSDVDTSNHSSRKVLQKNDSLGTIGQEYRNALCAFICQEGRAFMQERADAASLHLPSLNTGTSKTGLSSFKSDVGFDGKELPFPCTIFTSTMPRAVETVDWDNLSFPVESLSNFNPLDQGDFAGIDLCEIKKIDPRWYAKLEQNPFNTRYACVIADVSSFFICCLVCC